jgi:phosphate transport system ATP-binding protein
MVENKIVVEKLNCYYGKDQSVKSLSLNVIKNEILGIIGPANSGKTTFLKTLNRLNDYLPHFHRDGVITLDGEDVFRMDPETLRKKIAILFAMPIPLPMSIFDNVAYGPRRHGTKNKRALEELVETSLKSASLWDEVKDRLDSSAMKLSGGQQQRLCIAPDSGGGTGSDFI